MSGVNQVGGGSVPYMAQSYDFGKTEELQPPQSIDSSAAGSSEAHAHQVTVWREILLQQAEVFVAKQGIESFVAACGGRFSKKVACERKTALEAAGLLLSPRGFDLRFADSVAQEFYPDSPQGDFIRGLKKDESFRSAVYALCENSGIDQLLRYSQGIYGVVTPQDRARELLATVLTTPEHMQLTPMQVLALIKPHMQGKADLTQLLPEDFLNQSILIDSERPDFFLQDASVRNLLSVLGVEGKGHSALLEKLLNGDSRREVSFRDLPELIGGEGKDRLALLVDRSLLWQLIAKTLNEKVGLEKVNNMKLEEIEGKIKPEFFSSDQRYLLIVDDEVYSATTGPNVKGDLIFSEKLQSVEDLQKLYTDVRFSGRDLCLRTLENSFKGECEWKEVQDVVDEALGYLEGSLQDSVRAILAGDSRSRYEGSKLVTKRTAVTYLKMCSKAIKDKTFWTPSALSFQEKAENVKDQLGRVKSLLLDRFDEETVDTMISRYNVLREGSVAFGETMRLAFDVESSSYRFYTMGESDWEPLKGPVDIIALS